MLSSELRILLDRVEKQRPLHYTAEHDKDVCVSYLKHALVRLLKWERLDDYYELLEGE